MIKNNVGPICSVVWLGGKEKNLKIKTKKGLRWFFFGLGIIKQIQSGVYIVDVKPLKVKIQELFLMYDETVLIACFSFIHFFYSGGFPEWEKYIIGFP